LEVLFWLYAGGVLLVAIFQYHVIFDIEQLPVHEMMPAWSLPVYPFLALGPLAGTLLYSQPRPSSALPILVGGIAFQGLGWCFAFMQYTLYITRLTSGLRPDEPNRPGMFVAVGPAGMLFCRSRKLYLPEQHTLLKPSSISAVKLKSFSPRASLASPQFQQVTSGKLLE
jgi:tellurite resistance protein TehA-like permease